VILQFLENKDIFLLKGRLSQCAKIIIVAAVVTQPFIYHIFDVFIEGIICLLLAEVAFAVFLFS
jgi:hypothetical protein